MKFLMALTVIPVGLAGFAALAATTPETSPPPAAVQPGRGLEAWIRELSDESFRVREKASREIWELGEAALPALTEAAASQDPEQSYRARDLLRKIQLHITPETDPSVISLVEKYLKASPSEKAGLFGKMRGKRAWRQMLKLYAAETNADVREKLRSAVNGVAVKAARERLARGDSEGARGFLELAPADNDGLLALADFHLSHGTLEDELKRAREGNGRKSAVWQLALQRVAGNPAAAEEAARIAGDSGIAVAMAALAGDPVPWLREGRAGEEEDNRVARAYSSIATARWLGKKVRSADLEVLLRALSARDSTERGAAMNSLFLLGEVPAPEATFAKWKPVAAFAYFESLERVPEAFRALGLDPEQPDYQAWVKKRLKKLTADDVEDQHEASTDAEQLVILANFLERRGLHDEAFAAFSDPLTALAKEDLNAFIDFLTQLFGGREVLSGAPMVLSGAPMLAKRIGAAWAGDDENRWQDVIVAAFGEDAEVNEWWSWLGELKPGASRSERLDGMLALFGLGSDPENLRKTWLALAWKAVEAAPEAKRVELVTRISGLSMAGDVANALKAWDQLPESARNEVFWGQHIMHLSAVERWNQAAEVILKQVVASSTPGNEGVGADLHAYAASALRRAGRLDEASSHDAWAAKLALGDAALAIRIGNGYAYGGDYPRAAAWYRKATFLAAPDSSEFLLALKLHSDALLEDGQWKEAAATGELICLLYSGYENSGVSPLPLMRQRMQADMARALANLKDKRAESLAILRSCHRMFISDGSLADSFFPALRRVGLIKEHDEWFRESWEQMEKIIARYPESDNTRNTAAWFASRAMRKLDEAAKHLAKALASNPDQPAYLDTMAEIRFAKGDRKGALEWSAIAINYAPDDPQLRRQHERFRSAPLPK